LEKSAKELTPFPVEKKQREQNLFYLKVFRSAIIAALLLISVIVALFFKPQFSLQPVVYLLLLFLLISISFFFTGKLIAVRQSSYFEFFFDVIVITTLVYFSGGTVSPFYFLYLLPIVLAAFYLPPRGSFYLASFSFITFGVLSDLLYLKILPIFPEMDYLEISSTEFSYNLIMAFLAFTATAFVSSRYVERINKAKAEIHLLENNYQDLLLLNNSVLENMESGYLTANLQGIILSLNSRLQQSLNLQIGDNFFQKVFSADELNHLQRVLQYKNSFYLEKELGGYFWGINISRLTKLKDYSSLLVVLFNDLTAFRNIEKKLQEKERLALMGEMAAGLAHEIRNPLTSISGSIQFLKKELQLNEQQQKLMEIVINESQRLSSTIELFLNFSREFKVNKVKVNLAEIIESQICLLQVKYPEVHFKRFFNREITLIADYNLLSQLIRNILENSCKAITSPGMIEIEVVDLESKCQLSIRDNGIGMDKEELGKVFTPFYSRFSRGFGIGMAIVKRIADAHQIEIKIKSEKNRGTEVNLFIPCQ